MTPRHACGVPSRQQHRQHAAQACLPCTSQLSALPPPAAPQIRANLPPGVDGWGVSLRGLMGMVVVGGLIISAVFWWLNRTVSGGTAAMQQEFCKVVCLAGALPLSSGAAAACPVLQLVCAPCRRCKGRRRRKSEAGAACSPPLLSFPGCAGGAAGAGRHPQAREEEEGAHGCAQLSWVIIGSHSGARRSSEIKPACSAALSARCWLPKLSLPPSAGPPC